MKKYLFVLVVLIGLGTANAQEKKVTPAMEIGYGFLSSEGSGNSFSYRFAFGANYHITKGVYVGAKIGYNSANYSGLMDRRTSYDLQSHFITLPLEAGYILGNVEKFTATPIAGLDFNYQVKTKMKVGNEKRSSTMDDKFTVAARVGLRLGFNSFQLGGAYVIPLNDTHKKYFGSDAYPEISLGFSF